MEVLFYTIEFLVSIIDLGSLAVEIIPLIEASLSTVAIISGFFYFLYQKLQSSPKQVELPQFVTPKVAGSAFASHKKK